LGRKAVADVTEIDIERVMAAAPKAWEPATLKLLYSALHRLFDLAIMPGRLRTTNPVSRYLRPGKGAPKLFSYLYPAELLAVLGCIAVPLGRRVVYALAVYTGLRRGSLFALRWSGVDLENGTLLSTVSKTGIAQMFEIAPGLVSVLRAWHAYCGKPVPDKRIARDVKVDQHRLAPALRDDLRAAGVTRPVLFQVDAKNIEPLRFHDLRATFVTWAKRAGKGDGWISDRTGHVTPAMIDRYSRAARTLADLRIEPFPDLTSAIPELATKRPSAELGEPNGGDALPEIALNAAEYEQIRPLVVPGVAGSSPVTHPEVKGP
jgi:integrase